MSIMAEELNIAGQVYNNVKSRHDFVLLFDVKDGNPNGDPDAGNMPRVDPETMQGIVTDLAIKRKVRDYITLTESSNPYRQIYVKHRGILVNEHKAAYEANNLTEDTKDIKDVREWMCKHYYDVRMFGALMATKKYNAGQVRGPLQITFGRSIDPVNPQELTITRVALTNADDIKGGSLEDEEARTGQMGRKQFIPYGLYMAYGFFNPALAEQTFVSDEDLALFWNALMNMWTFDRSATRGMMSCRGLYVFSHESKYGNAQSQDLFDLIEITKNDDVEYARSFKDYNVKISDNIPSKVTLTRLLG